ncbi:PIN domain-containing protein [Demequina capsici]|uniref:PIN domain-containing protein n=1 Tax=Demequina capsici TaxID=3075620 RepID=A0AA96JD77_9MICO|nr:PIN domain-containing protein [Demequina sp. OYTSA14]WNM24389.1 PIN domain-containing protein [Demequina sp. OYTSA14]
MLLRLAHEGLYRPTWSATILAETECTLVDHLGRTPDKAAGRIAWMQDLFPDANVTGYEPIIDAMTNHPKDRHVLAAAVRADAAVIVTANIKDFPAAACDPYDVVAITPDTFFLDLLDLDRRRTISAMRQMCDDYAKPPQSLTELAAWIEDDMPGFARELRAEA